MLNDIKIVFYEDDKFKHQIGEVNLATGNLSDIDRIIKMIRKSENNQGGVCHFKIEAQSLDY